ncbi:MAG: MBL fold metallo-hydrolase [Magnetococcales bacterium]|nr:MBL fold metallo-hydrolase [Magnetococcales bacterium]
MKITILGSGTGLPSLERCAAGYLLQSDHRVDLIDCGSGILRQLEQVGVGFQSLDGLFITHTHSDHIGDLTALVHAFRLPGLEERSRPFHLFGPPGFQDFFNQVVQPVASPPTRFPFLIREVPKRWQMDDLTIQTCPTRHSDRFASVAYRFEQQSQSVVFSGDCDVDPEIIALSHQADLLICDCSTLAEEKVAGHLCATETGMIAQQAEVKQLVPTHFYPINGPDSQRLAECTQHYSGPITLAEDFLTFTLPSSEQSDQRQTPPDH